MIRLRDPLRKLASNLLLPRLWLPMSPGYPCGGCGEEECVCCSDGYRGQLDVTLAGFANGGGCTDSADINSTFTLDFESCFPDSIPVLCSWIYNWPTLLACGYTMLFKSLRLNAYGDGRIQVFATWKYRFAPGAVDPLDTWFYSATASPRNCGALSSLNSWATIYRFSDWYDDSAGTCSVSTTP